MDRRVTDAVVMGWAGTAAGTQGWDSKILMELEHTLGHYYLDELWLRLSLSGEL